jgi:plasmid stabilization system protein ParE
VTYAIVMLPRAESDFRHIFAYIEERSPDGAVRWRQAFEGAMTRLETTPLAYGYAAENDDVTVELRQILFRTKSGLTYRAVYFVEDDTVYISRIRGPGQPPLEADEIPLH